MRSEWVVDMKRWSALCICMMDFHTDWFFQSAISTQLLITLNKPWIKPGVPLNTWTVLSLILCVCVCVYFFFISNLTCDLRVWQAGVWYLLEAMFDPLVPVVEHIEPFHLPLPGRFHSDLLFTTILSNSVNRDRNMMTSSTELGSTGGFQLHVHNSSTPDTLTAFPQPATFINTLTTFSYWQQLTMSLCGPGCICATYSKSINTLIIQGGESN